MLLQNNVFFRKKHIGYFFENIAIVANVYHKGGIHVLNEVYFNGNLVVEGYKKRKHTKPRFRIIKDR